MDIEGDARRLVERSGVLRRPCDLDLVVFFARHPRTLMASEQLAAFLGYDVKEVAASLELLLDAGVLRRTPHPKHAARLYVFSVADSDGGWLPRLLKLASTRQGRLEMIWALRRQASDDTSDPVAREAAAPGPRRPVLVSEGRRQNA